MIAIGALDVSGSALGDGPDIGGECVGIALVEAFMAFADGFRDWAGARFDCGLGDGLPCTDAGATPDVWRGSGSDGDGYNVCLDPLSVWQAIEEGVARVMVSPIS